MNAFETDPRSFALEMVESGLVTADYLLLCALKHMSHDDVRDMLDANELSPRFDEYDDSDDDTEEIENWLYCIDDGEHDVEAMRADIAANNLEVGDDDRVEDYRHENIVRNSIANGQFTQAKEQCERFGLDYDLLRREFQS